MSVCVCVCVLRVQYGWAPPTLSPTQNAAYSTPGQGFYFYANGGTLYASVASGSASVGQSGGRGLGSSLSPGAFLTLSYNPTAGTIAGSVRLSSSSPPTTATSTVWYSNVPDNLVPAVLMYEANAQTMVQDE
jgi:hypothetical protein